MVQSAEGSKVIFVAFKPEHKGTRCYKVGIQSLVFSPLFIFNWGLITWVITIFPLWINKHRGLKVIKLTRAGMLFMELKYSNKIADLKLYTCYLFKNWNQTFLPKMEKIYGFKNSEFYKLKKLHLTHTRIIKCFSLENNSQNTGLIRVFPKIAECIPKVTVQRRLQEKNRNATTHSLFFV